MTSAVIDKLCYEKSALSVVEREEFNETELLDRLAKVEAALRIEDRPEWRYVYFHTRNLIASTLNKKFNYKMEIVSLLIINKELLRIEVNQEKEKK